MRFTKLVQCPNDCSKNGKCENGKCKCNEGYSSDDCSVYQREFSFGSTLRLSAYIYGNNFVLYQLTLPESSGYYDLIISLEQKSKLGKLHVYVNAGNEFIQPNFQ